MDDLASRLSMLKQMRWREAQQATGGVNDQPTNSLIRLHQAIVTIEATVAEGPPEHVWNVDIDGLPLPEVAKLLDETQLDPMP